MKKMIKTTAMLFLTMTVAISGVGCASIDKDTKSKTEDDLSADDIFPNKSSKAPYRIRVEKREEATGTHDNIFIDGKGYEKLNKNIQTEINDRIDKSKNEFETLFDEQSKLDIKMDYSSYSEICSSDKACIYRADKNVISFTYDSTNQWWNRRFAAYSFDVETGKQLSFKDLNIDLNTLRPFLEEKLTKLQEGVKDAFPDEGNSDELVEESVRLRMLEFEEQVIDGKEKRTITSSIENMESFSDTVTWYLDANGLNIRWSIVRGDVGWDFNTTVCVPYNKLEGIPKKYTKNNNSLSCFIDLYHNDNMMSTDVNNDGEEDILSFESDLNSAYFTLNQEGKNTTMVSNYNDVNYFYTQTSDSETYIIQVVMAYDRDTYRQYVNYINIYDLSDGTIKQRRNYEKRINITSVYNGVAFGLNEETNQFGYYRITENGLEEDNENYSDDNIEYKWKQAYRQALKEISSEYSEYALCYIDNDDIPEMMCIGNCEASGTLIYTYNNGKVTSQGFSRLYGLSYAERTGYICNSNMHMGYMFDVFFKLENGVFTELETGSGIEKYDSQTDEFNIDRTWEDNEVSEEEYRAKLEETLEKYHFNDESKKPKDDSYPLVEFIKNYL